MTTRFPGLVPLLLLVSALLGACANPPSAVPKDTLARISQTQTIRLGFREDAKPFAFKGPDGAPAGYSVELCKRVVTSLKSQLNLAKLDVQWVPVTVASRMPAVMDGTVDLECGSTSRTLGRERQVDFSNTIWVEGASYVSLSSKPIARAAELNGKRVGVIPGSTTEKVLKGLSERGVVPVFVTVQTHTDGIAAVRDGRADAYATDRLILVGEVLGGPAGSTLRLGDDYLSMETYSLMMRRDPDMRLAVNRALSDIYRSGEIVNVFRQAFPPSAVPSPLIEAVYVLNALPE
ncbi:glutamate/aspartate transport system substrate-binding protein [Variovorax sp. HW608]|uniref:amino acid ABC transporter substrate-binding protein n=1 Tax=Variovorax sp. HW608 TaxID=1034889 RepID=UPI00081F870D|nr:amino acid ABC transporter substrate-binding protein [Variovorax sp. HW608]SCK23425.1 glutamate/aspartate transport system substrate-binding protein [Variovorax sp. HW608]